MPSSSHTASAATKEIYRLGLVAANNLGVNWRHPRRPAAESRNSLIAIVNFPRSVVHAFRNVVFVSVPSHLVVTPGENFKTLLLELSAAAPTASSDMQVVAEVFRRYGLPIVKPVPAVA